MLGVDQSLPRRDEVELLQPGDLLLLYTDGLIERADTTITDRLEELRNASARASADNPDRFLDELLDRFAGNASDDIAMLALHIDHTPT